VGRRDRSAKYQTTARKLSVLLTTKLLPKSCLFFNLCPRSLFPAPRSLGSQKAACCCRKHTKSGKRAAHPESDSASPDHRGAAVPRADSNAKLGEGAQQPAKRTPRDELGVHPHGSELEGCLPQGYRGGLPLA